MRKYILVFLSTFIFILMPGIVAHAETTGLDFRSRSVSFGSSSTTSVGLISYNSPWSGDTTISFSFSAGSASVLPYTATLNMNDGNEYSCTLTSVQGDSQSGPITVSANCPFDYTGHHPTSISFTRSIVNNTGDILSLPVRVMVVKGLIFDTSSITNSQNNTTNAINGVNDSINNDNVSTNTENSSTANEWASASASDSVVSDMVLMPITLLNAFSSGFGGSCQAYNLGSLYGTNLTLPCIDISNYLGSTLWGIIDVLMSGFLIFGIGKKFVKVFNDFTNLKDSQVDELYGGGNE